MNTNEPPFPTIDFDFWSHQINAELSAAQSEEKTWAKIAIRAEGGRALLTAMKLDFQQKLLAAEALSHICDPLPQS